MTSPQNQKSRRPQTTREETSGLTNCRPRDLRPLINDDLTAQVAKAGNHSVIPVRVVSVEQGRVNTVPDRIAEYAEPSEPMVL